MCLETTTSYDTCTAVRTHLLVCASHIAHTRLQLDNEPCPAFRRRWQNPGRKGRDRCGCRCTTMPYGCERSRSRGYGEGGSTWGFEKERKVKGTMGAAAEQQTDYDKWPRGSGGHWEEEEREHRGAVGFGYSKMKVKLEDGIHEQRMKGTHPALEENINGQIKRRKTKQPDGAPTENDEAIFIEDRDERKFGSEFQFPPEDVEMAS